MLSPVTLSPVLPLEDGVDEAFSRLPDRRFAQDAVRPLVMYHSPCPDGFASALSAWLHFRERAEYQAVGHDDVLPDVTGRSVFLLDIAFLRPVMERLSAQAHSLVVLDHHLSAAQDLRGFRCACGQVHFDVDKSASRLAWEYFHPDKPVPELIQHVEDRDLLRFLVEGSEDYLSSLDSTPRTFERWESVLRMSPQESQTFRERGRPLRAQFLHLAEKLAQDAQPVLVNDEAGLMVNAPYVFHTDVGRFLGARAPYALMWCLESGGKRLRVGLRSFSGYNVLPIAKAFGGGGHPNCAGFRLDVKQLPQLLSGTLLSQA